jgi:hypothetical protein
MDCAQIDSLAMVAQKSDCYTEHQFWAGATIHKCTDKWNALLWFSFIFFKSIYYSSHKIRFVLSTL